MFVSLRGAFRVECEYLAIASVGGFTEVCRPSYIKQIVLIFAKDLMSLPKLLEVKQGVSHEAGKKGKVGIFKFKPQTCEVIDSVLKICFKVIDNGCHAEL